MKFRMFTDARSNVKIAVNVDKVIFVGLSNNGKNTTIIWLNEIFGYGTDVEVVEDFDTVLSRLNTIAE